MKTLFKAISRFLLLSLLAVQVNGQIVDLRQAPYNMTAADTVTLDKRFASFAEASNSPALKAFCGWLTYIGASSTWNQWRLHEAYPRNALWANDDYVGVTYYPNGLGSKAGIIFPAGEYLMSHWIIKVQAGFWGAGSGGFYDANPNAAGGTTFILDRKKWKGEPGDNSGIKACFRDNLWGNLQNSGYMEGSGLYGCKILGGAGDLYDPTVHESGILCWTAGEQYNIEDVHIYSFNDYGVEMQGTRHATFSSTRLSIFLCNRAGIGVIAGGHLENYLGSFDDNPAAYEALPDANGSIGNGTYINCFGVKFETGKTDARPRSKAQLLLKAKGWVKFNAFGCSYSCVNTKPPYLVEIETTKNVSKVSLYGMDWFDTPAYLLHDLSRNELIPMDAPVSANFSMSNIIDFKWRSDGWYEAEGVTLPAPITGVSDTRLAPLANVYDAACNCEKFVGGWDLVAGTPAYSYTQGMAGEPGSTPVTPPPPTPCTGWTVGAWSTCTNGTQTRTVTPSPAGCTGTPTVVKPAESQTCTTTTPTWTVLWDGSKVTPANQVTPTTCTAVNATVTKIRLTNWTPSALSYGRIVGTGAGKPSLQVYPDGFFYFNNVKVSSTLTGKVVAGTKYASVTITIPSSTVTAAWNTDCAQGGACPGTCEKLEGQ